MCQVKTTRRAMYQVKITRRAMCQVKTTRRVMCQVKTTRRVMCQVKTTRRAMCQVKTTFRALYRSLKSLILLILNFTEFPFASRLVSANYNVFFISSVAIPISESSFITLNQ
jgi:hypothetical protein